MADVSRDNPVVLSTIYTRTGDDGTTGLSDFSRVAKTDSRLAAYADTDEANCAVGAALTLGGLPEDIVALLRRIQNELFDCGADLATPLPPAATSRRRAPSSSIPATPTRSRARVAAPPQNSPPSLQSGRSAAGRTRCCSHQLA